MGKFGYMLVVTALASSAAYAQSVSTQAGPGGASVTTGGGLNVQAGSAAQHSGSERPRGVVTGGTGDGGIALQSDQAKAQAGSAVSGGVSVNARDNMRSQTPPHNVKMVFSLTTGNYVSDVQVKVTDRSGRVVLEDVSNGPWLYAKLPPGSYTATASYNGAPVTQKFTVGGKGARTAQFRWPPSVEQQGVGSAGADAGGQILGTGPQEAQR